MAAKISFFVSPARKKKALPQALLCDCVEVVEERRPRGRHGTYCRHMYASWPGKTSVPSEKAAGYQSSHSFNHPRLVAPNQARPWP